MTSSLLLKIFAFLSLAATGAAVAMWHSSGEPPPSGMLQLSLAFFLAALVTGLIGAETRPRLMLRFLSALCALIAAIALAADISAQGGVFGATSLLGHLEQFAPSLLASIKASITRALGGGFWDSVAISVMSIPTFLFFGLLAIFCGYAGRQRRAISVFVN
jgi:hypothetical protein